MPRGRRKPSPNASKRVATHQQRRRKGQANRDPARKHSAPGAPARNPAGSKGMVGIVGSRFPGPMPKFRGRKPDKNNPKGGRSRRRRK